MLDLMRKHARNWLMKTILGIIIVVFVFYFGSIGGRERAERIAMVDGKPIVYADYQREYQNLVDMYRARFGQGLTEEMLKSLNLKKQALDNMINQALIFRKADEMGIKVTEDEVKAVILAYPGFQMNGAFNQRLYEQNLRTVKMTADEFEENQRKMMISLKVEALIREGASVADQEVRELYRMQNEKIDIDFVEISPKSFTGNVKPAPADLAAYLKAHEAQFRVPEQVQIKYLAFLGQNYAAPSKVSDADVADYYDRNKQQWTKDKQVRPLAEVKDKIVAELAAVNGMYSASDEAKKAHDTIYQNENFDAYAAEKKLPVRTTGLFRLDQPPEEFRPMADFAKAVSRLQKGEISRVLQSDKGYYLIQLVTRKSPYVPDLKEIEPEVEKLYREGEAQRLAQKEAETLLSRLTKGEGMEAVSREKGLKVVETGLFQPGGAIPKLGSSPDLTEALFLLSEKKPYPEKVYRVDGNFVVIRFKERGKLNEAEFATQKDAITNYLAKQKKDEIVRAWIEGSRAALIKEGRLEFLRDIKDL